MALRSAAWRIGLTAGLETPPPPVVSLGWTGFDGVFPHGGLAAGTHQFAGLGDEAGPLGFAGAILARTLAAQPRAQALLVQAAAAARETGRLYAPGLQALGLDPDRLGMVSVPDGTAALVVVDEALRSGAVAAVLANLGAVRRLDLTITRRFNLAARRSGALALLVTPDLAATSAAMTRWRIAAAAASRASRRRLGRPTFNLVLMRNRTGPTGEWTLEWDSDARLFRPPAPPLSLARPAASGQVGPSSSARKGDDRAAAGRYRQTG